MSRSGTSIERLAFASRTTFEGLTVDTGEESEDEQFPESSLEACVDQASAIQKTPSKPLKKKAAKATRLEKRQRKTSKPPMSDTLPTPTSPSVEPACSLPEDQSIPADVKAVADQVTVTISPPLSPEVDAEAIKNTEDASPSTIPPDTSTLVSPVTSGFTTPYEPKKNVDDNFGQAVEERFKSQEAEKTKKRQNVVTRTIWTLIMIGGFIGLLLLGHAYLVLLVMLCQTLVYREVTALFSLKSTARGSNEAECKQKDPWSKTLNWYFFAVTNYFLYGESIIYYFKHVVFADAQLLPFATNHRILSFTLYTIGFMGFVMSLKKGYLKQQFGLFCWVHMTLLLIVVSSHFVVNNILEGLIWFWVPASLVICNDVFAYIWGVTFGRTPLIKLSPKKTVEGFVGAFFSTIVFGILWGSYFMRFDYMLCPVQNLGVSAWSSSGCEPNPVFVWREWTMWKPLAVLASAVLRRSVTTITYAPYQWHLLFMSCFASLVAPFGGFFASGFKRAFDIKDFGHSIPGHGGMTDRMDCQFLMGVFTYVYYSSLIREHHVTVGSILQTIVSGLTVDEQMELMMELKRYLEGQGIKAP